VPFRLLGLAAHPDHAGDLCGQAFLRYAALGTDITLVCAAARDCSAAASKPAARQLGVRDLVLLDFGLSELTATALEDVFVDVMASLRPHVVVADETQPAIREASARAFLRVRREIGGSAALPAKLYYRPSADTPAARVTTVLGGPRPAAPEPFIRVFPNPWVTGVLERDLFAGVAIDTGGNSERIDRLAS
jgi:LmbE family N-acetylglucosaminyl deacetylase